MLTRENFLTLNITEHSKVAIISHNDLDGAGPIILSKSFFVDDCRHFTVANHTVDKVLKLVLFAPEYANLDYIFLTDCSIIDENLAETVNKINILQGKKKIFMFDHHSTALKYNKYEWAVVSTEQEQLCGSKLFWEYLKPFVSKEGFTNFRYLEKELEFYDRLINCINDYDLWLWEAKKDLEPKLLSELYTKTGINYFIQKYDKKRLFEYGYEIFNDGDKAMLTDFENKYKFIIWPGIERSSRIADLTFETKDGEPIKRKVKLASISDAIGDSAEKLYEEGIDTVIFFYADSVSARTRDESLHLGNWSEFMSAGGSGGGHEKSAGFRINKTNKWLLDAYLEMKFTI